MARQPVRHVRLCSPIDPIDLFSRLARALDIQVHDTHPETIVQQGFPDLNSKFRDTYLLREVLRKYPAFDLGVDTKSVALASFLDDEGLNSLTNDRLRTYNRENPCVNRILYLASRKAVRVLGRFPVEEFLEGLRFGPGATTTKTRKTSSAEWKLSTDLHVTQNALKLAEASLREFPIWEALRGSFNASLRVNNFERLECVPKNAKTDRTIGIGPDFNVMGQLAVDRLIRKRLFRAGVNLSDQTINQTRALEGSLTGELATIDLKSASNSITSGLVWRILGDHPMDTFDDRWYRLLDTLRVEYVRLPDGKSHEYELFSAMGNGATFSVESLIFWALSAATCDFLGIPENVTVYGDDIVLPSKAVSTLREVFAWCGLRFNEDKSFFNETGPLFRESCGKHYLNGNDVTPFYVDKPLTTVDQVFVLANNIVRWSVTPYGRDGRMLPVWLWVVSHLPDKARRCRIPYSGSDDGLLSDFDEACPSVHKMCCGTPIGYKVKTISRTYVVDRSWTGDIAYAADRYKAHAKRFSPPAGTRHWSQALVRELLDTPSGDVWSLHYKGRTVTDWPYLGPWVRDDCLTSCMGVDFEIFVMLLRSRLV